MELRQAAPASPRYQQLRLLVATTLLLSFIALAPLAEAEYVGAAAPSGVKCRVFVHATHQQTSFLLVESAADQDSVAIADDFPVIRGALSAIPLENVYKKLRPSFFKIQELLLAREKPLLVEPRHCHTHLVTSGPAMRALDKAQLDAIYARIHQETIEDAQFPFLLARDDLRTIPAELQSYFLIIGANYLDGKVVAALTPGKDELYGLLSFSEYSAEMVFDNLERWRRTKRQRQTHIPLNMSDFFSREYAGYGRNAIQDAITSQLATRQDKEEDSATSALEHPCFFKGFEDDTKDGDDDARAAIKGTGDAKACIKEIQAYVDEGNAACPEDSFCVLNGLAQPRNMLSTFYGAGLFRSAVVYANKVLQARQSEDTTIQSLVMPTPTLASLREAADSFCALPFPYIEASKLLYRESGTSTDIPSSDKLHACLDLCYAIVLLKQFGIQEDAERVHFVSQYQYRSASSSSSSSSMKRTTEEQATWLTGAFLYLEAVQQRKAFVVEAELLAVQVDEGVPIGFNLSMLLFVAALGFVYWTTGTRRHGGSGSAAGLSKKSSSYQRVVSGVSGKAKQHEHSTQAIVFIDDASE